MTYNDELGSAVERLADELVDGAGDERGGDELAYATVSDLRIILTALRKQGEALEFYAREHEFPSDGPWGVNSDDFGNVARQALSPNTQAREGEG